MAPLAPLVLAGKLQLLVEGAPIWHLQGASGRQSAVQQGAEQMLRPSCRGCWLRRLCEWQLLAGMAA